MSSFPAGSGPTVHTIHAASSSETSEAQHISSRPLPPQTYTSWLKSYFGVQRLDEIRWGHAVNSLEHLTAVLEANSKSSCLGQHILKPIHMLEIDLRIRSNVTTSENHDEEKVVSSPVGPIDTDVILAHDANAPGPSFILWLQQFTRHLDSSQGVRLGLKLDFKVPEAVLPALACVLRYKHIFEARQVPIWLNADVLPGFGVIHTEDKAIDARYHTVQSFVGESCLAWLTQGATLGGPMGLVLSVGWRTKNIFPGKLIQFCQNEESKAVPTALSDVVSPRQLVSTPLYSADDLCQLVASIHELVAAINCPDQPRSRGFAHITFPLRAAFVPASVDALIKALTHLNASSSSSYFSQSLSFTLWQNANDVWLKDELEQACERLRATGAEIYVDLE